VKWAECRQGDLTAAGVGETLDGLLGKNTHPDVRQNAAPYTAIMQNAGFGSLEILLKYDDVELNEMDDQLIKDGIPRGHSMEIRKQIKLRRPNGGSGNAGSPSAIDPSVGPPAPPPPLPRPPTSPEEVYIAHARKRIAELAEILRRKPDTKATIASDGDCREPRLGKGLAKQQWKVNALCLRHHISLPLHTPLTACAAALGAGKRLHGLAVPALHRCT
jgi:hypothetical protein